MFKILLPIFLLLNLITFSSANTSKDTSSALGNITGGPCKVENDCIIGCKKGQNSSSICISKTEGNDQCLKATISSPGELACTCLKDVKRCGYQFPIK